MFKYLFIFLVIYLGFKFFRSIFRGLFFISQIPRQDTEKEQNSESQRKPYVYRGGLKEKDISDRARILEDDKKLDQKE
jgi:hypothetical protein